MRRAAWRRRCRRPGSPRRLGASRPASSRKERSRFFALIWSPKGAVALAYAAAVVVMLSGFDPADLARKAGMARLENATGAAVAAARASAVERIGALEEKAYRSFMAFTGRVTGYSRATLANALSLVMRTEQPAPARPPEERRRPGRPDKRRWRAPRRQPRAGRRTEHRVADLRPPLQEKDTMEDTTTTPGPGTAAPLPPPPFVAPVPLPHAPVAIDQKSPGLAGFLSVFPGLGHLYLGLYQRAFAFAGAFCILIFFNSHGRMAVLSGPATAFLWFFAIIDAVRQAKAINSGRLAEGGWAPETADPTGLAEHGGSDVGRDPRRPRLAVADRPLRRHRLVLHGALGRPGRADPARHHPHRRPRAASKRKEHADGVGMPPRSNVGDLPALPVAPSPQSRRVSSAGPGDWGETGDWETAITAA